MARERRERPSPVDGPSCSASWANDAGRAAGDGAAPPTAAGPVAAAAVDTSSVPTEAELPIQDYDSLAASQVVPRLATMSRDDLLAVRDYELAHRNRQTILNRISQRLAE